MYSNKYFWILSQIQSGQIDPEKKESVVAKLHSESKMTRNMVMKARNEVRSDPIPGRNDYIPGHFFLPGKEFGTNGLFFRVSLTRMFWECIDPSSVLRIV